MEQCPTILNISKFSEDHYRLELHQPGERFLGPSETYWDVKANLQIFTTFCNRISKAMNEANTSPRKKGIC